MLGRMRLVSALLLAFAVPAGAGQRAHSFQVGAVVVRSARVRATAARIELTASHPVAVSIDSAPPRLEAPGDLTVPAGAVRVTVQY